MTVHESDSSISLRKRCSLFLRRVESGLQKLEAEIRASTALIEEHERQKKKNAARQSRLLSPSDLEWEPVKSRVKHSKVKVKFQSRTKSYQRPPITQVSDLPASDMNDISQQSTNNDNVLVVVAAAAAANTTVSDELLRNVSYKNLDNPRCEFSSFLKCHKRRLDQDRTRVLDSYHQCLRSACEKVIQLFMDTLLLPRRCVDRQEKSAKWPSELELACLRAYGNGIPLDIEWDDAEEGPDAYYAPLPEIFPNGERFLPFIASFHGVCSFENAIGQSWFPPTLAGHLVVTAIELGFFKEAEDLFNALYDGEPMSNEHNFIPFPLNLVVGHVRLFINGCHRLIREEPVHILEPWFWELWDGIVAEGVTLHGLDELVLSTFEFTLGVTGLSDHDLGVRKKGEWNGAKWFRLVSQRERAEAAEVARHVVQVLVRQFLKYIVNGTSESDQVTQLRGILQKFVLRTVDKRRLSNTRQGKPLDNGSFRVTKAIIYAIVLMLPCRQLQTQMPDIAKELVQTLLEAFNCSREYETYRLCQSDTEDDDERELCMGIDEIARELATILQSLNCSEPMVVIETNKQQNVSSSSSSSSSSRNRFLMPIQKQIGDWLFNLGKIAFDSFPDTPDCIDDTQFRISQFMTITKLVSSTFDHLAKLDPSYSWSIYVNSINRLMMSAPNLSTYDLNLPEQKGQKALVTGWKYDKGIGDYVAVSPKKGKPRFRVVVPTAINNASAQEDPSQRKGMFLSEVRVGTTSKSSLCELKDISTFEQTRKPSFEVVIDINEKENPRRPITRSRAPITDENRKRKFQDFCEDVAAKRTDMYKIERSPLALRSRRNVENIQFQMLL